jgi:16S rRNA C967 or C1407 C5-methylase (RsmB/RsmF family)/NOL1/NOP2/fmu family ribosome biogenesis protein
LPVHLPEKLIQSLKKSKGFDEYEFIRIHQSGEQVTSVRLNPVKYSSMLNDGSWIELSSFIIQQKIPWSSHGYYLSERPSFTLDPLLHAGAYYVQEASSMFLEEVLKQSVDLKKNLRVLDLCAAPGGKSTLIQSLISTESLLISNEVIKQRVNILTENMTKWGVENVIVTNNDPKDFSLLENFFDVIVVDAPCSGSGLFRKEPEAINEWSEENMLLCNRRQQRILADIMPALKQNGILIYSTCSYSKEEDEDILDWLAENFDVEGLRLKADENWGIVESSAQKGNGYGYRFYPDKLKGEGFFIAACRKKNGDDFYPSKIKKNNFEKLTKNEEAMVKKWTHDEKNTMLFKNDTLVYALPENLFNDLNFLKSTLYIRKAGVRLGKITPHELIPEHELALSTLINGNVPSIELSKEQALSYLRKQEIKMDTRVNRWCLVKYQNQHLGWIKILQNRINNYYPLEWRIRI